MIEILRAGSGLEGAKIRIAMLLEAEGDHDIDVVSLDDPRSWTVAIGVWCKICRSGFKGSIPFAAKHAPEGLDGVIIMKLEEMASLFMKEFPSSCEEARRLKVVRDVMES